MSSAASSATASSAASFGSCQYCTMNSLYVTYTMIYKPIQMHYAVSDVVLQQEAHI